VSTLLSRSVNQVLVPLVRRVELAYAQAYTVGLLTAVQQVAAASIAAVAAAAATAAAAAAVQPVVQAKHSVAEEEAPHSKHIDADVGYTIGHTSVHRDVNDCVV
jgi:hypothetical protein